MDIFTAFPDSIQQGVWKYLESVNDEPVFGCARQVSGGAVIDGGFGSELDAGAVCGLSSAGILAEDGIQLLTEDDQFLMPEDE